MSLGWPCSERLSAAVLVSYGSGANAAVRLLLKELVISKEANISAHFNHCVSWWSPPSGSRSRPLWYCGFRPTPYGEFILGMWVAASPNPPYGSSISRWGGLFLFPTWNFLTFFGKVQSPLLWLTANMQLYSVLNPLPHNSFFIWLQWSDI